MKKNFEPEDSVDCRRKHTVCDAMFWSYLQGDLDPAEALLVATHYHLSPEARKRVNALNDCAAVSLESLEPVAMKCSLEEFFKKCCDDKQAKKEECADKSASIPVPKPLQSYIGPCFEGVTWQNVLPGIAEKRLKICRSSASIKLMKIDKGVTVPAHGHLGNEITLVLHGSFEDEGELYKTGEVGYHESKEGFTHAPTAKEECICLIVASEAARFPGIWGTLVKPFLRWRTV